jgi:mono/diheme cytochrome c family protein
MKLVLGNNTKYKMRNKLLLTGSFALAIFASSCFRDAKKPGLEYMPDMAHPVSVETYDESKNPDINANRTSNKFSALQPVKGTVPTAQGMLPFKNEDYDNTTSYKPYHHEFSPEGEKASDADLNPLEKTEINLTEGKRLYEIYCSPCHGKEGNADGTVTIANNHAFPMGAPFSYFTDANLAITEGHMFYITQYGRNSMGSYASQLNPNERWKVIMYVKQMQADYTSKNSASKKEEKKDDKKKA